MMCGTPHAGATAKDAFHGGQQLLAGRGVVVADGQVTRGMVLVVDDDEGVRAVMATALEDEGWIVATAENGRTALDTLVWARPEAIILDLRMPIMDGLSFAERYREFPEPRAPLILISATVTQAAVQATGAVTGLRKPVDLNVLLETVRAYAMARNHD
jgi:two-component system, chemotaxis family, chemotaxis protein CheY